MNPTNFQNLRKFIHTSGQFYEAILQSSFFWLPSSHSLNKYFLLSNPDELHSDLLIYLHFSNNLKAHTNGVIVNPLQTIADLFNIIIYVRKNSHFTTTIPFQANAQDFLHYICIEAEDSGNYFALLK